MTIQYIADDGTIFADRWECEDYEWKNNHTHLHEIKLFDKSGAELTDILSEYSYNNCYKIKVPTEESLRDLHDLISYMGFCEYETITETGTWGYTDKYGFKKSF